jgi:ABC-2 type transport system permease protein
VNLTYLRIDLVRQVRDVGNLAFIIGLPVVTYLVFGSGAAHSEEMVWRGNVQFYVMVSMAVYGAPVATTSISGMAAVELVQGWGRQLALTPMAPPAYAATKVLIALTVAAGAVAAVFVAGLLTDAQATSAGVWISAALLAWLLSAIFALFGLAVAQTFRSESSVTIASAGLVLLAFLGNLFVPLSGGDPRHRPVHAHVRVLGARALAATPGTDHRRRRRDRPRPDVGSDSQRRRVVGDLRAHRGMGGTAGPTSPVTVAARTGLAIPSAAASNIETLSHDIL